MFYVMLIRIHLNREMVLSKKECHTNSTMERQEEFLM